MSQSLLLCFGMAGEIKRIKQYGWWRYKDIGKPIYKSKRNLLGFKLYWSGLCRSEQFMLLVLCWLVSVLAIFYFDNDYIDILHNTLLQEEME